MRRISLDEFKSIQVEILTRVHEFCQHNQLGYSLAYGSLLGAVRHKGFIPWDDDIDIIMQRPDYDKFIASFNQESQYPFRVISYVTDPQIHYPMAKVVNDSTIKNEVGYNKYGVGIDVFPIDKIPIDNEKVHKLFRVQNRYWMMFMLKSMRWSKTRRTVNNIILVLSKVLLCFIDYSFLNKKMNRNARKYENLTGEYNLACLFSPYGEKEIASKEIYEKTIPLIFEGKEFKCLKEYNKYLTQIYGDYMQLPPVEQQVSHHAFEGYWKI